MQLFGMFSNEPGLSLINCLLICARFVIYRCKVANRLPTIIKFVSFVKSTKGTELICEAGCRPSASFEVVESGIIMCEL